MEAIPELLSLPAEIIQEILVRLGTKSLLKCRAVCKSWRSLIQTSTFIDNHLSHTIQSNNQNHLHLFLLQTTLWHDEDTYPPESTVYSLHWDNPALGHKYTKLDDPFELAACLPPSSVDHEICCCCSHTVFVVGTINGVICLVAPPYQDLNTTILLWNPCIRKVVILPRPPSVTLMYDNHKVRYAFGYDSRTTDYKVLRVVSYVWKRRSSCQVEIWTLARGSWMKQSKIPPEFLPHFSIDEDGPALFVNGALHWIRRPLTKGADYFIVTFDMSTELFGKIMMPKAMVKVSHYISRYRESLALFEMKKPKNTGDYRPFTINMWVMKEYGMAGSWTKLFTTCLNGEPYCFTEIGGVIVLKSNGELLQVDSKTKQVNSFDFESIDHDGQSVEFLDSFVQSLVLIDQPNAISY